MTYTEAQTHASNINVEFFTGRKPFMAAIRAAMDKIVAQRPVKKDVEIVVFTDNSEMEIDYSADGPPHFKAV